MDKAKGYLNIEVAHEKAVSEFAQRDPADISEKSATMFDSGENFIRLFFLNKDYFVYYPSGEIIDSEGEKASIYHAIIFLHYLNTADGTPLSGNWISFKELSGGEIYNQAFYKRAQKPFLKAFEDAPEKFVEAASKLGGFKLPFGDYGMVIPVLPRVPLAMVLTPGDDEIETTCTILFDSRANSYLPTEDYAHIPGLVIGEMRKMI